MKQTIFIIAIGLISIFVFLVFLLQGTTHPSLDTRIILERHYKTYIAPPCFEQSDPEPTHFLDETSLKEAKAMNFDPHDACTEEMLKGEKEASIISLLKNNGILSSKWDEW
ncbi:MAG TPA: hypothetical protein VIG73_11510 [Cerasibacillus sp.]|uniref:hypothetical protein n=1 Tax=Cerasibacillus sp. TaxID=2498711 RepID=UPI002F407AF8